MTSNGPADTPAPTPGVPPKTSAEEREARAEEALKRIFSGGNLGQETLALSNDFTDEYTGRLRSWFRRVSGRAPR